MTTISLLSLFQQSMPIGIVVLIVLLFKASWDIKAINSKIYDIAGSLKRIDEKLNNHITDTTKEIKETNKQIADLKVEMYKKFGEIQVSLEKLSKS